MILNDWSFICRNNKSVTGRIQENLQIIYYTHDKEAWTHLSSDILRQRKKNIMYVSGHIHQNKELSVILNLHLGTFDHDVKDGHSWLIFK